MRSGVLFVVNATVPPGTARPVDPRKDHDALAARLGADVLDRAAVQQSRLGRLAARAPRGHAGG